MQLKKWYQIEDSSLPQSSSSHGEKSFEANSNCAREQEVQKNML